MFGKKVPRTEQQNQAAKQRGEKAYLANQRRNAKNAYKAEAREAQRKRRT